eukprot:TRINITY_DN4212_c0_g3_i1.p1 TRINITY_DN4212_c0_g3~~TRINITY_DN4212_c0_g3_i1.p1  ORF type:complete len:213 (+),score=22.57 TRINITY_DN4212_c0_g3_i1:224-862(+)
MAEMMKEVVISYPAELSVEERSLLSVAYKNIIGNRRASFRILSSIQQKREQENLSPMLRQMMKGYISKINNESINICNDIIYLLDCFLIPHTFVQENKIFYLKMKSDYYRYLSEFAEGKDRKEQNEKSISTMKEALNDLAPTSPMFLSLSLSYSVFSYEILNQRQQAITIARRAFDSALEQIDNLDEDNYREVTLLMQLLRDNLTLWEADEQ